MSIEENVVDITTELKTRRFVEQFSRLWNLVERQAEEVRRNPEPFLRRAHEEIAERQRFIENVRSVLWRMDISAYSDPNMIVDPRQQDHEKLRAIERLLREWDAR